MRRQTATPIRAAGSDREWDTTGVPRRRSRSRRWRLWIVAGLAVLAVALGIVLGLRLRTIATQVSREAALGREDLTAGAAVLKSGTSGLTRPKVAIALGHFQHAETHFHLAHDALVHGRLMAVANRLPFVSLQVDAGRNLADMGVHMSRAGQMAAQILDEVLAGGGPGAARSQGPGKKALSLMDSIDPKLSSIEHELNTVASDRSKLSMPGLIGPLSKAVSDFDSKVKLDKARSMLSSIRADEQPVRALLGVAGPRSYMVLQQDPAELRATGGFIGSVGYLNFDRGTLAPYQPRDVYDIDGHDLYGALLGPRGSPKHVDPPAPLEQIFRLQSWELRDSNWWPDFPTSARQAEFFLHQEAGKQVDGVIAMDPFFIAKLLSITGPVTVPETGDVVDQNNFFTTALTRIEVPNGVGLKNRFLSAAGKAIFPRLLTLSPEKWYALVQAMQWGCETRSLQAYVHDPTVEAFIDRYQCGGEVRTLPGDGVMVVDSNVGGNKDDFWLQRSFQLGLAVQPDGSVRHTLHLHYGGLAPHGYVTARWGYTGWLRVYLPKTASIVSVQGARLSPTEDLGRRVLQGWLYVQFYHEADVTIVYDIDASSLRSAGRRLQLLWQKQAGRAGDSIQVSLSLPSGMRLRSAQTGTERSTAATIRSDLSVDRDFSFEYSPG